MFFLLGSNKFLGGKYKGEKKNQALAADAFGVLAPDARQMLLRIASLLQKTKMYPEHLERKRVCDVLNTRLLRGDRRESVQLCAARCYNWHLCWWISVVGDSQQRVAGLLHARHSGVAQ